MHWHKLALEDGDVIFDDTVAAKARWRNRCHEFVRWIDPQFHDECFPGKSSKGNYGSCIPDKVVAWENYLQQHFKFRRDPNEIGGDVYLIHTSAPKGEIQVYGSGLY